MKSFFAFYARNLTELLRILSLVLCAFFLPMLFMRSKLPIKNQPSQAQFRLGLENISSSLLKNLNGNAVTHVTVITNQTGLDQQGRKTVDILLSKGFCIDAILVPESEQMPNPDLLYTQTHKKKSIPIARLYTAHKGVRRINIEKFGAKSAILFDMQDVGMRHYSYVTIMLDTLEAAARTNKPIIVLDRPNLLGEGMEGPLVDFPTISSALSSISIPVRYGMTIGELARYVNSSFLCNAANLIVVPMHHYHRKISTYELLSNLSPNIKNIGSCHGYSFLGLLGEVTPFDVGVGTDNAFQCIMLPDSIKISKHQWHELRGILKYYGIKSSKHHCFSKRKKKFCTGLRIQITDINNFSAFNTLLAVLDFFKKAGVSLSYSQTFDKALGTTKVRRCLTGLVGREELEQEINANIQQFFKNAVSAFMYRPLPRIIEA